MHGRGIGHHGSFSMCVHKKELSKYTHIMYINAPKENKLGPEFTKPGTHPVLWEKSAHPVLRKKTTLKTLQHRFHWESPRISPKYPRILNVWAQNIPGQRRGGAAAAPRQRRGGAAAPRQRLWARNISPFTSSGSLSFSVHKNAMFN